MTSVMVWGGGAFGACHPEEIKSFGQTGILTLGFQPPELLEMYFYPICGILLQEKQ